MNELLNKLRDSSHFVDEPYPNSSFTFKDPITKEAFSISFKKTTLDFEFSIYGLYHMYPLDTVFWFDNHWKGSGVPLDAYPEWMQILMKEIIAFVDSRDRLRRILL